MVIFNPLQELGNIIPAYGEAVAALSRFAQLIKKPIKHSPESPVKVSPIENLRFENALFRHTGVDQNALNGLLKPATPLNSSSGEACTTSCGGSRPASERLTY